MVLVTAVPITTMDHKKSEVAERNHGSKFRSASTDRPAGARAGLADVACDFCDQAWHYQPGEVSLPQVMLCPLVALATFRRKISDFGIVADEVRKARPAGLAAGVI